MKSFALLVSLMFICCASNTQAPVQRAPRELMAPVEVLVLCAPTPLRAEGKFNLVYELHITNFAEKDVTLTGVKVLGNKSTAPLAIYEGSQVADKLSTVGRTASDKARLGGGQRLVVYVWVTVDSESAIPDTLRHRLTFEGFDDAGHQVQMSVVAGETIVNKEKPIVIQPPLRGGPWRAQGGPSNDSIHRRATMAVDGTTYDAQRFAIDWVKLGTNNERCSGGCGKNENYYAYGSEIFAVADGTVAELVDGIPDNIPGLIPPETRSVERAPGNRIVLDIGSGHYALYAHMEPGKMRVRSGDHVHAGEVLGLAGNSGHSGGPHLHFHLMNRPRPLAADGLPYVFWSFDVGGHAHTMEMPTDNMVVRFPDSH